MKKFGILLIATAFVCSSGFFKKGKDGSYSVDTAAAEKKANEVAAQASAEADKMTQQASTMSEVADIKIKEAAAKMNVPKEEILADLEKPLADIKTKVEAMDPVKLTAYLNQYNNVLTDSQAKVSDYTQQVKDLKFTQKFSKKGKEAKAQLEKYTGQYSGLKEQGSVYLSKLTSFGFDPAMLGIDLSAYGL
jgi:cell division septum initiation protein DivIVA